MNFIKQFVDAFKEGLNENKGVISFYKLEGNAVEFIKDNHKKGLKNPIYLDVTIKKEATQFHVNYKSYYQEILSKEYKVSEKTGTFSAIQNIPKQILYLIEKEGKAKVKIENVVELLSEDLSDILSPIFFKEIEGIFDINKSKLEHSGKQVNGVRIVIEDKLFKKKIEIFFATKENDSEKILRKSFLFEDVLEMPKDLETILNSKGRVEIEL